MGSEMQSVILPLRPTVAGLFTWERKLLLGRNRKNGKYDVVQGGMEPGENQREALYEETSEEYSREIADLIGWLYDVGTDTRPMKPFEKEGVWYGGKFYHYVGSALVGKPSLSPGKEFYDFCLVDHEQAQRMLLSREDHKMKILSRMIYTLRCMNKIS